MSILKLIPQTEADFYSIANELTTYTNKLETIFSRKVLELSTSHHYYLSYFFVLVAYLYSSNYDALTNPPVFKYFKDHDRAFCDLVNGCLTMPTARGLVINQEASTHFDPTEYKSPRFMPAVEEHLKQTPNHFIKVFVTDDTRTLNVYTNKELEGKTLYKLLELETKLHNEDNKFFIALIQEMIKNNLNAVNKMLEDFLTSDIVQDIKFKRFEKVLTSFDDHKIEQVKRAIANMRDTINDYENEIAKLATEIREKTENLNFLMTQTNDDESNKRLYKYLSKHPYIKEFTPHRTSEINFYIESPVVYFNEVPIEKYIEQANRSTYHTAILRLFLSGEYELWTKTAITFDTKTFNVKKGSIISAPTQFLIPHPHIMEYQCFGNHRTAIAESAESHDYIGAIEQISQATMNINFYDVCVVDSMLDKLSTYRHTITWKKKSTGEFMDTCDAVIANEGTLPTIDY